MVYDEADKDKINKVIERVFMVKYPNNKIRKLAILLCKLTMEGVLPKNNYLQSHPLGNVFIYTLVGASQSGYLNAIHILKLK